MTAADVAGERRQYAQRIEACGRKGGHMATKVSMEARRR